MFHVPKIEHVNTWSFPILETNPSFLIKELVEYFCISIFVTFIVYKYGVLISLRQEDNLLQEEQQRFPNLQGFNTFSTFITRTI